ncbi:MAG: hypothetical protein ACKO4T_03160, partial [Planctomycetaceae bacterium]
MMTRSSIRLVAAMTVTLIATVAFAQDGGGKADPAEKAAQDELQKETDTFVKALQERGEFDEAAKSFVTKVALQKLRQTPKQRRLAGGDKLEASMDRIRDALSGRKVADATGAGAKVREAAAAWLVEQARAAPPAVAANAALLLGDLRADGKPWLDGSRRLAAVAADASLPASVRAAAVAGLARSVEEITARPPAPAEFVEAIAPSMVAIITAPASDNDAAGRWLVSRALDVTTRLVPVASPEIAKAL